jgi:PKD repeat protein
VVPVAKAKVLEYEWDFGDGTFSTQENPIHTYTQPGSYTVCLKAYTTSETVAVHKPDYIVVDATLPAAGFGGVVLLVLCMGVLLPRRRPL